MFLIKRFGWGSQARRINIVAVVADDDDCIVHDGGIVNSTCHDSHWIVDFGALNHVTSSH